MVSIHPIQAVKSAGAKAKAKVDNMSTKQKVAAVATVAVAATALTAAYISGKDRFNKGDVLNKKGEKLANNAFNKVRVGFGNLFKAASAKVVSIKDSIVNRFQGKTEEIPVKDAPGGPFAGLEVDDKLKEKIDEIQEMAPEAASKAE